MEQLLQLEKQIREAEKANAAHLLQLRKMLGAELARQRREAGLSQAAAARAIPVSRPTYLRLERGERPFHKKRYYKPLKKAFDAARR